MGKKHIPIPPPTGKEEPQHQYVSPYLDQVEAIQSELKSAAADGRKPNLDGYSSVDLAGAGVYVVNPDEGVEVPTEKVPDANKGGATTVNVQATPNQSK